MLWHAKIASIRVKNGRGPKLPGKKEKVGTVWLKLLWFFTGEDAEQLEVYKNDVADWWESFQMRCATWIHMDWTGSWGI